MTTQANIINRILNDDKANQKITKGMKQMRRNLERISKQSWTTVRSRRCSGKSAFLDELIQQLYCVNIAKEKIVDSDKKEDKRHYYFKITMPIIENDKNQIKELVFLNSQISYLLKIIKDFFKENPKYLIPCDKKFREAELAENEFRIFFSLDDVQNNMQLVKNRMEQQNLTAYTVAKILNVSETCITKIIKSQSDAGLEVAVKFAELLGISHKVFLPEKRNGCENV